MGRALALIVLLALAAAPAAARPVDSAPRPAPRPDAMDGVLPRVPLAPVYYNATIRPMPRPARASAGPILLVPVQYSADIRPHPRPRSAQRPGRVLEVASRVGLAGSVRPAARPGREMVVAGIRRKPVVAGAGESGTICGDPSIRGEALSPISGRIAGCGVARPVRVSAVDGVALTPAATMDCDTARALNRWVSTGVKPAVGRLGGGVSSLRVVASYACRTRNNKPGAKISEHGKGRAVDVAAITLQNGISLSVLKGWSDPVQGKLLRQMHKAACGPFGTVLGPGSDGYHRDHFHLDTARHRGGSYCR